MPKDTITNLKIPCFYILLNGKFEKFNIVFYNIIKIVTQSNKYILHFKTMITDIEQGLINTVKKYFTKCIKNNILLSLPIRNNKNIKAFVLYKKDYKE